jgi:hypothetical protein
MKISPHKKTFIAILTAFFLTTNPSYAWTGYDYDNKTEVEIGPGNLVREGLVFQFYDSKSDNYHTAKVLFMDSVAGGTRIQLQDLDTKKERIFIMQD